MYQYKVESLISVVDGDTIEVMLDLGFDHYYKNKVRLVGIDTPESRTTDLAEKKYGIEAKEFVKHTLEKSKIIVVKTEKPDSTEKFGRILGTIFVDNNTESLNDLLVRYGLAWRYDGGTKHKDFAVLDKARAESGFPLH